MGKLAIFDWLRKRSPTGGEGGAADEQLRAVGDSVQAAGAAAASAAPPGRISLSERVRLSLNRCVEIQAHHLVHIFKFHVPRFRARSDLTSFEEFNLNFSCIRDAELTAQLAEVSLAMDSATPEEQPAALCKAFRFLMDRASLMP